MAQYAKVSNSGYGGTDSGYSDKSIDLRSALYFEALRSNSEIPAAGVRDDIYVTRTRIRYELNNNRITSSYDPMYN